MRLTSRSLDWLRPVLRKSFWMEVRDFRWPYSDFSFQQSFLSPVVSTSVFIINVDRLNRFGRVGE